MTEEQAKQLAEIHAAVVHGLPASEALVAAARNVVETRYQERRSWEELSEAIRVLAEVLGTKP